LQLRDPHHAAALGGNEARQKLFQFDILRFHRVTAGSQFEARLGELREPFRQIGIGGRRMKRSQRLAVDHQRDGEIVGATDAIKWFRILPTTKLNLSRSLK